MQYNRARYYSSDIGHWMSQDPIEFQAGDENLYRYVGNTSTIYTDPTGLITFGPGAGLNGHAGFIHIGVSIDITIGINTNPESAWDIFSGAISLTPHGSVCSNFGAGLGADVHVTGKTAPYAGDLGGEGVIAGANLGPGTIEYVGGDHSDGISIGLGAGIGGGIYSDVSGTIIARIVGKSPDRDESRFFPPRRPTNRPGSVDLYLRP